MAGTTAMKLAIGDTSKFGFDHGLQYQAPKSSMEAVEKPARTQCAQINVQKLDLI